MKFTLPELPYKYDSLEPFIDAKTMEIHHTKHHQAYIDKLNGVLDSYEDLQKESLEWLLGNLDNLPVEIAMAVQNNGGGHANHSLFWEVMAADGTRTPSGELAKAIDEEFNSFEAFKAEFSEAAKTRFGSGWAWLTLEKGSLHICSTANQDSPLMKKNTPLLGLDVWEHAYYLKYQNRRPDYVEAWWNVVDWRGVEKRFKAGLENF